MFYHSFRVFCGNKCATFCQFLAICAIFLLFISCQKPQTIRNFQFQNGDLLFTALPANYDLTASADEITEMMAAVADSSERNYIHVSIVEVENGTPWIIDATLKRGVERYPLDTFLVDFTLQNGNLPLFEVFRLKNTENVHFFVENAKNFVGKQYNCHFLPCDSAQYCSELVRNAYVTPNSDTLFAQSPIDFRLKNGAMPIYWEQLFAILQQPIPQGVRGILPSAMTQAPILERVAKF